MGMHCLKALPNLICIADIEQCIVLCDSVVVRVFCVLSVHLTTCVCTVGLKQIPQIFEYSFVLQYSNTIFTIRLFVCNHVGLNMHILSTTWSWDSNNIIDGTYLVTRT